jgi:hypothetical protein
LRAAPDPREDGLKVRTVSPSHSQSDRLPGAREALCARARPRAGAAALRPRRPRALLLAWVAALGWAVVAQGSDLTAQQTARIEYLIATVGLLGQAQFIRNGTAYDAHAAVDHMRLKLRFAGARVKTAEDFIRYCATESSVSGEPYEIRFADGRRVPAAQFLLQKLEEYDRRQSVGAAGAASPSR